MINKAHIVLLFLALCTVPGTLLSQISDSLKTKADTLGTSGGGGMDTVVVYDARDSVVFDVATKKARLYGDAYIIKGNQKLTAHYIEIDFDKSELYAEAGYDSATGKRIGVPVFRDGNEELSAATLRYNFITKRGTLGAAETMIENGFYYGDKIKRVGENTVYVQDGRYTTCDAPHPHFYIASPRMKVIKDDRVFADQVALYVADVPVIWLPFGVYFASRNGKQSGIIIPTWGQNALRGFTLEGLGYFWAVNDYVDLRLTANLYSKGGYTLEKFTRFRWRGVIQLSDLNIKYGATRTSPDDPYVENFILSYTHQQKIGKLTSLDGYLYFASQNAIRNTTTHNDPLNRLNDYSTQNVTSNLSYSTQLFGGGFSANYSRTLNVLTGSYTEVLPTISYSRPSITPFAGTDNFFENLSLGITSTYRRQHSLSDTIAGTGGARIDNVQSGITHTPSISFTPKLGYFSIGPSFSYTESWFFRRLHKQVINDTVVDEFTNGFNRAYSWSAGVSLSTKLYGIIQPRLFGINAIRHILVPTVSVSYSPDFGANSFGFYDEYIDPKTNKTVKYSVFSGDAGAATIPGSGLRQVISLNLQNTFEAKIAQGDTIEDKKVQLLSIGGFTSYNAAAPNNLRWDPVTITANTDLGAIGYLSGYMTLDVYRTDTSGVRIAEYLLDHGQGLFRTTDASVTFRTRYGSSGFNTGTSGQSLRADSAGMRRQRFDFSPIAFDDREFFGDRVRGNGGFGIPWELGLSGSYTVTRAFGKPDSLINSVTITTDLSVSPTPSLSISANVSYNPVTRTFNNPSIGFHKDLHDWNMDFSWQPSGSARGFYFKLSMKAPQLQDIKIERQGYGN